MLINVYFDIWVILMEVLPFSNINGMYRFQPGHGANTGHRDKLYDDSRKCAVG